MSAADKTSKKKSVSKSTQAALVLSAVIPGGIAGLSACLRATAQAAFAPSQTSPAAISERLESIRAAVSAAQEIELSGKTTSPADPSVEVAWWWRNGGWRNGGWRNGGWGNGGWHNWNNGWHNWGNGWHNW